LSQEAKETGIPRVGAASQQFTRVRSSLCSGSATTLLPWRGSACLLSVSQP
jgi:hypothetical protein